MWRTVLALLMSRFSIFDRVPVPGVRFVKETATKNPGNASPATRCRSAETRIAAASQRLHQPRTAGTGSWARSAIFGVKARGSGGGAPGTAEHVANNIATASGSLLATPEKKRAAAISRCMLGHRRGQ